MCKLAGPTFRHPFWHFARSATPGPCWGKTFMVSSMIHYGIPVIHLFVGFKEVKETPLYTAGAFRTLYDSCLRSPASGGP